MIASSRNILLFQRRILSPHRVVRYLVAVLGLALFACALTQVPDKLKPAWTQRLGSWPRLVGLPIMLRHGGTSEFSVELCDLSAIIALGASPPAVRAERETGPLGAR